MDKISEILKQIQKTNSGMDRQKLIEELSKSRYSAMALIIACQNNGKPESLSA